MATRFSESSRVELERQPFRAPGGSTRFVGSNQGSTRNQPAQSALFETRDHGERGHGERGSRGLDVQTIAFTRRAIEHRRLWHRLFFAQLPAPFPTQLPEDRSFICVASD